jgi:hypothetical protein
MEEEIVQKVILL